MACGEVLRKRMEKLAYELEHKAAHTDPGSGLGYALRVTAQEIRAALSEDRRACNGGR